MACRCSAAARTPGSGLPARWTRLENLLRERFPGFTALVTAADVPGRLSIGLGGDDPVFVDGEVTCVSAPIALATATTRAVAEQAAAYVGSQCVVYEDLAAILTLEDAIAQHSLLEPPSGFHAHPEHDRHVLITRAGSDAKWLEDPGPPLGDTATLSGQLRTGAQAHFYLETNCAWRFPGRTGRSPFTARLRTPMATRRRSHGCWA